MVNGCAWSNLILHCVVIAQRSEAKRSKARKRIDVSLLFRFSIPRCIYWPVDRFNSDTPWDRNTTPIRRDIRHIFPFSSFSSSSSLFLLLPISDTLSVSPSGLDGDDPLQNKTSSLAGWVFVCTYSRMLFLLSNIIPIERGYFFPPLCWLYCGALAWAWLGLAWLGLAWLPKNLCFSFSFSFCHFPLLLQQSFLYLLCVCTRAYLSSPVRCCSSSGSVG